MTKVEEAGGGGTKAILVVAEGGGEPLEAALAELPTWHDERD